MKPVQITFLFLALACIFTMQSCKKKEDRIDPKLTLLGDSMITLDSTNYIEYGATAYDAEDGDLVPVITNSINLNKLGTYSVKYTAYDNAGNRASISRIVKVNNFAKKLGGLYQIHQVNLDSNGVAMDSSDYTQTLSASTVFNWNLVFSKWFNKTYLINTFKMSAYINNINHSIIIAPSPAASTKYGYEIVQIGGLNLERKQVYHYFSGVGVYNNSTNYLLSVKDSIKNQYQYRLSTTATYRDTTVSFEEKKFKIQMSK